MEWLAIVVLAGGLLLSIFAPRDWLLFGDRWTLKDGDRAEPSDLYVWLIRAGGVVGLVIMVVFGFLLFSAEQERRTKYAWETYTEPPVLSVVAVSDDIEAQGPELTVSQVLHLGDDPLPTSQAEPGYEPTDAHLLHAVVGSDDADPRMEVPEAVDGDLVLKVRDTRHCDVVRVGVQEKHDAVRIAVFYGENATSSATYDALDDDEPSPNPCLGRSGLAYGWQEGARVVHLPLDEPLGSREVFENDSGRPIPPVSKGDREDDEQ